MRIGQYIYGDEGWTLVSGVDTDRPSLILVFASPDLSDISHALESLRDRCPFAHIAGCTTGGEILGDEALDGYITATSVEFSRSHVHVHACELSDRRDSFGVGRRVAGALSAPDLKGILVLSDGLDTNGVMLVRGIRDGLGCEIPVFGGLAADGSDFVVTRVAGNGAMRSGGCVAVGFYGGSLEVGNTVASGWVTAGPGLPITNASGSMIYEIDGRPALDVYCETNGLRRDGGMGQFMTRPLWLCEADKPDQGVMRSVMGIEDRSGCLVMASDLPPNAHYRTVAGRPEDLISAAGAASRALCGVPCNALSLIVSCVGRRRYLGERRVAEIKAISRPLGTVHQAGFYAYGEFGQSMLTGQSEFFNHATSITAIWEHR